MNGDTMPDKPRTQSQASTPHANGNTQPTLSKNASSPHTNSKTTKEKPISKAPRNTPQNASDPNPPNTPKKAQKRRDRPQPAGKPVKKRQRNQSGDDAKHGSYRRYYARRLGEADASQDDRLPLLRAQWLLDSGRGRILDVGCNDGTFTMEVARRFPYAQVLGVEIDRALVGKARKAVRVKAVEKKASMRTNSVCVNVRDGQNVAAVVGGKEVDSVKGATASSDVNAKAAPQRFTPISCHVVQGPLPEPAVVGDKENTNTRQGPTSGEKPTDGAVLAKAPSSADVADVEFPFNLTFRNDNLAAETPCQTAQETGSYDIVLCLSVTKWVHMRGGDSALKRFFARMRDCLRPGGVMVLEPQLKKSYKLARRKGAVENAPTFAELKLRPEQFKDYLLGKEGGFESMEMLRDVRESGQAFNRPVMAFFKSTESVQELDNVEAQGAPRS